MTPSLTVQVVGSLQVETGNGEKRMRSRREKQPLPVRVHLMWFYFILLSFSWVFQRNIPLKTCVGFHPDKLLSVCVRKYFCLLLSTENKATVTDDQHPDDV